MRAPFPPLSQIPYTSSSGSSTNGKESIQMTLMHSKRLLVTLTLLLAVLLIIALLASGSILYTAHMTSIHLFANTSTPDVVIHNH